MVAARGAEGLEAALAAGGVEGAVTLDMDDPGAPARAVAEAEALVGPLDIVVANAGGPPAGRFVDVDEAGWELAVRRNLLGTVRLIRAALPGMRARGWGRVVTITSSSVREPIDGLALSNATRAGVAGVVRTLAREVAAEGVTVNNVMPGAILTDRLRELAGPVPDEALARRAGAIPAGRIGRPEEVGDVVAFLCGEPAGYVTGISIFVDGGAARAHRVTEAGPTDRVPPFRFSVRTRVEFSDTDAVGVVYYGRYPPYFDLALGEYRRHLGLPLLGEPGHLYLIRAFHAEYHDSARFDDRIEVFVRYARLGRSSHAAELRVEGAGRGRSAAPGRRAHHDRGRRPHWAGAPPRCRTPGGSASSPSRGIALEVA